MPKTQKNPTLQNGLKQLKQALTHIDQENPEKAIELLLQIIEETRKAQNSLEEVHLIAIVQENLGVLYIELYELEEALYYFDKALLNLSMVLEHNPNMTQLYEDKALILIDMAMLHRSLQEYDPAIEASLKAIECYTTMKEEKQSDIYAIKGEISMIKAEVAEVEDGEQNKEAKHLKKAIEYYTLALKSDANNHTYLKERTLAQIILADNYSLNYDTTKKALALLEEALVSFETLLQSDGEDEQLVMSSANTKAHIGRIYREFGEIYVALEKFEEAINDYEAYLKIVHFNYEAIDHIAVNLNNIANIYMSIEKKDKVPTLLNRAIEYLSRVLEESSKDDDGYNKLIVEEVIYHKAIAEIDLSRFYMEQGQLSSAKEIAQTIIDESNKYIEQYPKNINLLNQKALATIIVADIYDIENQATKAIASYQRAITIFDQALTLKPHDLFSLNHRGLAKGDIVTSYIYLDKKEEGEFWFQEAMKDYQRIIELSPTFTDATINRAVLLSDWAYANKHSIAQEELLKLLLQSIAEYEKVLEVNPYHFSAMNNRLTISSDIAQIYKERNEIERALELYYKEVEGYREFLAIYNNDLMSFMNAGVSKVLLAQALLEKQQEKEALTFLESSLEDYDKALSSDKHDMETLINRALALREMIEIKPSVEYLTENQKLNHKILEQYDNYFVNVEYEKDTYSLTHNMLFPLASFLYGKHLKGKNRKFSPNESREILETLERTKAKTLKMIMDRSLEEESMELLNKEYRTLQKKLSELKKELREIQISVTLRTEKTQELKGFKNVPKEEIKRVEVALEKSLKEREKLYQEFHYHNKELAKIFSIEEMDGENFYENLVDKIEETSMVLYPLYYEERSELQIVAIGKKSGALSIQIHHKILNEDVKFSNFILFIKDVEEFLTLNEKQRATKLKGLNGKYANLNSETLKLVFQLDNEGKIVKAKVDHSTFMNNLRYKIIQSALQHLSSIFIEAIPQDVKKVYISAFGDLNMLPLHALPLDKQNYLIDNYEVLYIPSLALWSKLKASESTENLYVSQDYLNQNSCYHEVTSCQAIIEGQHQNHIESQAFKTLVHQKEFNLLHLSVHGVADLKNPLNSVLLFEQSQLSLLEIQGLNLKANLVVLSACESNLAKVEGADELLAFERAFMIAGATNIVSTFDTVTLHGAEKIMTDLYKQKKEGKSFSEAFQYAIIQSINSENLDWMLFRFMGI